MYHVYYSRIKTSSGTAGVDWNQSKLELVFSNSSRGYLVLQVPQVEMSFCRLSDEWSVNNACGHDDQQSGRSQYGSRLKHLDRQLARKPNLHFTLHSKHQFQREA